MLNNVAWSSVLFQKKFHRWSARAILHCMVHIVTRDDVSSGALADAIGVHTELSQQPRHERVGEGLQGL